MADADLYFRSIDVRRMPGFPAGQGFMLDGLSPGVNIIYGPNASGKTTLSRAIQVLLRPQDGPKTGHVLRAALDLRGQAWTIDYDVGKTACQRGGAEAECPALAPPEVKHHYVLALHDLVAAEDGRDLAARIVRESAGGYDVAEARAALGFRARPSAKGKAFRDLEAAIAARREAEAGQEALLDQERELGGLRKRQADALAAQDRLRRIERAIALCDAAERRRQAVAELDAFAPALAAMTGDEASRLDAIEEALHEAAEETRREEAQHRAAADRMAACALPPQGVPSEQIAALRRKCQRLQTAIAEAGAHAKEAEKASVRVAEARSALGAAADAAAGAARLDTAAVARLADLARRLEKVRAESAAAETLREWLGADADGAALSSDASGQAAALLLRWLAADEAATQVSALGARRTPALLAGAAAVAVAAVVMAAVAHWSWLGLVAVAIGLVVWAFLPGRSLDRREELRRAFESLGVEGPAAWEPAEVKALAVQLQRRAAEAEIQRERAARWAGLGARVERCERLRTEAEESRRRLVEELGLPLEMAGADENWLSVLADGIRRVQEAEEARAAARAALEAVRREAETLARDVATALREYGFDETLDADLLAEQVEALGRRAQEHESARAEAAARERALLRIAEDVRRWTAEREETLARLGLGPDGGATLRVWAAQLPEYRGAADAARLAERELRAAEAALAGEGDQNGDASPSAPESRDVLEARRAECAALAAQAQEIAQRIGQIEGALEEAKRRTDLETALAREAECREALRAERDRDCAAVAGHVLAGFLARHEHERTRPGVFEDARRLFVRLTHGRYRLDIDAGDPPGFRAFDTHREEGLALDELSSGTRLQLLLAVRVAFVQRQEQGPRLPLVFDETLGNSDERRAEQIIEAAVELCRSGRQVFYLTAQHDEVGKWQAVLKRHPDVPGRVIDLAEVRRFSETERVPRMDFALPPPPEVPPPGDLGWLEYGRLLGVPPLDPDAEAGGVHLWYLIDDPPALHRLLRQGINRWGQLQALVQFGHDEALRADAPLVRRAEAAARLLQAALRLAQAGRGAPVDRQVLVDCPAVSHAFLDRVADLAAEHGGDARALVGALGQGRVKGFRANKLAELRDYLTGRGCLDERDRLSPEQMREQVRPLVFPDLEAGRLTLERFETLLAIVISTTSRSPPPRPAPCI